MRNTLAIINRKKTLFVDDLKFFSDRINRIVNTSRFLVIGAGGSIGKAVCKEIFKKLNMKSQERKNIVLGKLQ